MNSPGSLFLVATPIGNLEDISLRSVRILFSVQIIACEDTRRSSLLISQLFQTYKDFLQLPINKPRLISYFDRVEQQKVPYLISRLLAGDYIALISDSGTPLICDPGLRLVAECLKRNIKVRSIPGPTALISAITVSGYPADRFVFLGFLPKNQNGRRKLLQKWQAISKTSIQQLLLVFYESPHRINDALKDFLEVFGDCEICLCRELTKIHEQVFKGKVSEAISSFKTVKGEIVLLMNLNKI